MSKSIIREKKALETIIKDSIVKNEIEAINGSICQKYCDEIDEILKKMIEIEKIQNLKNENVRFDIIKSIYEEINEKKINFSEDVYNTVNKYEDSPNENLLSVYVCTDEHFLLHYHSTKTKLSCIWTEVYPVQKLIIERRVNKDIMLAIYSQIIQKFPNKAYLKNDLLEKVSQNEKTYKTSYDYSSDTDDEGVFDKKLLKKIKNNQNIDNEKELVPQKNENLSQRTIKLHKTSLKTLENKANIKEIDYENSDYVLNVLYKLRNEEKISNASIKNYVDAINWHFNENNDIFTENQKKAYMNYKHVSYKMQKKYQNFLIDGNMTEKNKLSHIDNNDIISIVENSKTIAMPLEFLIMKMYLEFPRRSDLLNLIYLTNYNDIEKYTGVNFYIKEKDEFRFVFLEFKNTKKTNDKDKVLNLSNELADLLNQYIKENEIKPGERIIEEKYYKNASTTLRNIFFKYTGKHISINSLRHIAASKDPEDNRELLDKARKMAHTPLMHMLYKRKNN